MGSKVRLAVFDMDGVLIDSYSSWVLVHRHFGTDNEDNLQAFLRGEIDDMEFIRRDVERWTDARGRVSLGEVHRILDTAPIFPGAIEVLNELDRRGVTTAIVSGGLRYLAERVGAMGKVDYVLANDVDVDEGGYLTGKGIVHVPLKEKGAVVSMIQDKIGVSVEETAVVGDTPVDVTMFDMAGVSIAFNPMDELTRRSAGHVVEGRDLRLVLPFMVDDDTV